jgi:uncharacterized protein YgbK (DUF1537 family)
MVGIQADDLTGACDTGAPFAERGLRTLVILGDGDTPPSLPPSDIVVLDTESRSLPVEEARARARMAGRTLAAGSPRILYKKMDSTLRGRAAAEVDGMLDGAGAALALVAPAFPAQRRTVVDGCVRVDGQTAEATAVARDPGFPSTGASALALLAAAGVGPVTPLPLVTVRRGAPAVRDRLQRFAVTGGRAVVADTETDGDLAILADASVGRRHLLAGSAGLAAALVAGLPAPDPGERAARRVPLRRPLVVVAGSAHPATHAQLAELRPREGLDVLRPPSDRGADDPRRRAEVARRLADAVRAGVERSRPGALFLTGGDTAIATLRALGAGGLRLTGELEPGVALGALVGGPFDGLGLVTKAGGFGDPDLLIRVWEACA